MGSVLKAGKKVIVLAGPTGVGKSAVSLALARRLDRKAEIISADSVQVKKKSHLISSHLMSCHVMKYFHLY